MTALPTDPNPTGSASRISLVIPAYNEEKYLPALLESVAVARARYEAAGGTVEVIVADNASTDRTAEVAAAAGCRVIPVPTRSIAAARNGGARAGDGEVLCFVDADSRIHPDTFVAIHRALDPETVIAGATGVILERRSPGIVLVFALLLPFIWLTGFDTGVVFCRRVDFEAVGGYDERRRLGEDVALLAALRRRGKRRGQRLIRLTRIKAVASVRKFDQHGDWHYFRFLGMVVAYLAGTRSAKERLERYWYDPGR